MLREQPLPKRSIHENHNTYNKRPTFIWHFFLRYVAYFYRFYLKYAIVPFFSLKLCIMALQHAGKMCDRHFSLCATLREASFDQKFTIISYLACAINSIQAKIWRNRTLQKNFQNKSKGSRLKYGYWASSRLWQKLG